VIWIGHGSLTFLDELCSLDAVSNLLLVGQMALAGKSLVQPWPEVVISLRILSPQEQKIWRANMSVAAATAGCVCVYVCVCTSIDSDDLVTERRGRRGHVRQAVANALVQWADFELVQRDLTVDWNYQCRLSPRSFKIGVWRGRWVLGSSSLT
jgi:hypothetical protein